MSQRSKQLLLRRLSLQAVQRVFCNFAGWRVLVICVPAGMSEARGCRLSAEEATTLLQSGSFWPGSMLDKDTFMELLANVLSLEFYYQISEWEKQLIATGALGDAGKVDVQRFVVALSVSTTLSDADTILMPQLGPQFLAPTSGTVSQTAAPQADACADSITLTYSTGWAG
eukprot:6334472-Amphidinium_carterae.1